MRGLIAAPLLLSRNALAQTNPDEIRAGLADLEKTRGGRLGVCVLDVATGRRVAHRGDERFAMCSTHKFLAAAFVLQRVDRGKTDSIRASRTRRTISSLTPRSRKNMPATE